MQIPGCRKKNHASPPTRHAPKSGPAPRQRLLRITACVTTGGSPEHETFPSGQLRATICVFMAQAKHWRSSLNLDMRMVGVGCEDRKLFIVATVFHVIAGQPLGLDTNWCGCAIGENRMLLLVPKSRNSGTN